MKTIAEIEAIIRSNAQNNRATFAGLTTAEISKRNRAAMFGENDEAFPDQDEWSSWVD